MEKIPTAEEFLSIKFNELKSSFAIEDIQEMMIDFARLHVKAALKSASKLEEPHGIEGYKIDLDSILTAYPPENIK